LAQARGASVIGAASEPDHEFLRSLAATPVRYGEGLLERVRAVAPPGVDLAPDTAGHGGLPDLIELTDSPAQRHHHRRLRRRAGRCTGDHRPGLVGVEFEDTPRFMISRLCP
jgi:hypothetical protein